MRWKKHVPPRRDEDPRWRRRLWASSLEEVVLTTSERIPEDHRILNALRFLSGLRPSSEATFRFSDIGGRRKPTLVVSCTGPIKEKPPQPDEAAGAQMVTRTGIEPMFSA